MNSTAIENRLDFARMAFEGGRLTEAEQIYSSVVEQTNNAAAWFGLGLSKLAQTADASRTVSEAVSCFRKAKTLDPSSSKVLDTELEEFSLGMIKELCDAQTKLIELERKAQKDKKWQIADLAVSAALGAAMKDAGTMAKGVLAGSAGLAAVGLTKSVHDAKSAKEALFRARELTVQVRTGVCELLGDPTRFRETVAKYEAAVPQFVDVEEVKRRKAAENTLRSRRAMAGTFTFLGVHYSMAGRPLGFYAYLAGWLIGFATLGLGVGGVVLLVLLGFAIYDSVRVFKGSFKNKAGMNAFPLRLPDAGTSVS